MNEMPYAFRCIIRVARKRHICCECGNEVHPGERYEYSSGIWDGAPESFKTCTICAEIRGAVLHHPEEGYEDLAFRELKNWFLDKEYSGYSGSDLLYGEAEFYGVDPEKLNRLLNINLSSEEAA